MILQIKAKLILLVDSYKIIISTVIVLKLLRKIAELIDIYSPLETYLEF